MGKVFDLNGNDLTKTDATMRVPEAPADAAAVGKQSDAQTESLKAEKSRAEGAEQKLQQQVDTLNNGQAESLKTEKKLQQQVDTLNAGGLNLKEELIRTQVDSYLTQHPEAMGTAMAEEVTRAKAAEEENAKGVSQLKEGLGEIYETDITSIGEYRQGQYVEYLTGKIKPSDNYEMLVFANKQYDKISVLCGHTDDIPASVAFFSNMTIDTTSYQKQSIKATIGEKNYIVSIPSDCKVIAISNRKREYEIKGSVSYGTEEVLKKTLQNIEEIQKLKNTQKTEVLIQGCFVADKYNDSSLVKDGLILDDGTIYETNKNKYTLHISLENVRYIKYENLYGKYKYGGKNLVGMTFYDDYHKISKSPEFTSELQAGVIDLYDFPDAKYMRFCNYSSDLPVSVELFCETEKEAKDRKKCMSESIISLVGLNGNCQIYILQKDCYKSLMAECRFGVGLCITHTVAMHGYILHILT